MIRPEKLLSCIHRAAPMAIGVVVNRKFEIINARLCEMLGYSQDELIGQSAEMIYENHSEFERVGKEKYEMMAVHGTGTIETQWQTKQGRLIDVLLSSTPIDDSDWSKGITFTAIDITEEKASKKENAKIISTMESVIVDRMRWLNENNIKLLSEIDKRKNIEKKLRVSKKELQSTIVELQQTQAQIIQAEKMASIGQLAAGVAHEINNPTAFVSSNLHTMGQYQEEMAVLLKRYDTILAQLTGLELIDDFPEQITEAIAAARKYSEEIDLDFIREDFSELIEESREGTERIKKIVANLKDFAHPGVQTQEETDINQGMDAAINMVWNEIKYKSELNRDYADLPPVWCYTQQINQVFLNLLINATQAIDKKGEITVRTRRSNGHVVVQVIDNGCGIPEEIQSQIFNPFFTTKEVGKGTGLGLSLAYSIIEKHNGRIELESAASEGATFTVYLPITKLQNPES